jgi:hypothetical protein
MTAVSVASERLVSGAAERLVASLRPGRVYRREDLAEMSTAVDRHVRELLKEGRVKKLAQGMYYVPKVSSYGPVPPEDAEVVGSFLRDTEFLVFSPSAYNAVGLGTTQLYNRTLVYNHKRHGVFKLGNRQFDFRVKPRFPKKLTPEFLFVDLLNNLEQLAEDRDAVLRQAQSKLSSFDLDKLKRALSTFGSVATRKRAKGWLSV